ncbi:DGPF domain-containing protein [Mycolicibacterium mageritense DSM 44476 = CIP 104973]|uniref:Transcription initiation protein n=1 Tax=Mycolicibacterium mageritense TaxID=53462 RepID=A0AAI8XLP9_MYCME|nr:YciI family protein [Mycolicibacterium mageritense]MBN3452449.1 transcription initiation protein [Mycobacterium sp. DSM 3803]OKH73055.1 transcription initiation protein [Mycobacterium sp. SWH-M3]MCC9183105.1 YciI family protein [Mycolicibacterium mageritense]CDO20565.1 DGPF domain-containing protein [Mycolicibacterium mageritense DSM 44476 = CIP 104973]BBX34918.1 transcription initiation protein [Mycolicibacterium mageritense]
MHYFALLINREQALTPEQGAEEMTAYLAFHAKAGSAIRAGDALTPAAGAVRISGGPDNPTVTDGPFAEGAEVAGGYYVFEADNLDEALALAQDIPAAKYGAVEVWPMVHWQAPEQPLTNDWLALLLEPPEKIHTPGTDEWNQQAGQHVELAKTIGDRTLAGAPLHPPSTATTVRVRDGQVSLTDGPYAEGAEVANGFYVLRAADRDEAVKLASMIPASAIEVRQLSGIAGL